MPLTTALLAQAACDTSSNPLLQGIWADVQAYNNLGPVAPGSAQLGPAVQLLDRLYESCGTYMTRKSFHKYKRQWEKDLGIHIDAKRPLRYAAFTDLLGQVNREMSHLGGKFLAGPADFKANVGDNYWLERLDPDHRPGMELGQFYADWQNLKKQNTFFEYMGKEKEPAVRYADTPLWGDCVFFDGAVLKYAIDDGIFSTNPLQTFFSGKGWAIWVCSMPICDPQNNFETYIFSSTHNKGDQHHSSFLSGKPVLAAGEWIVDDTGTVQVITSKSGHYQPDVQHMTNFVNKFTQIPGDAYIRVSWEKPPKYYRVSDLRMNPDAVRSGATAPVRNSDAVQRIAQLAPNCAAILRR